MRGHKGGGAQHRLPFLAQVEIAKEPSVQEHLHRLARLARGGPRGEAHTQPRVDARRAEGFLRHPPVAGGEAVAADAIAGSPRGRRSGRDARQRHFRANAERSVGLSAAVASGTGSRNETHATCVTVAPRSEAARGGEEAEEAASASSSDSETTMRG